MKAQKRARKTAYLRSGHNLIPIAMDHGCEDSFVFGVLFNSEHLIRLLKKISAQKSPFFHLTLMGVQIDGRCQIKLTVPGLDDEPVITADKEQTAKG